MFETWNFAKFHGFRRRRATSPKYEDDIKIDCFELRSQKQLLAPHFFGAIFLMRFHIDLNNCPTTYLPWQRSIKHFLKHFQLLWISQKSSNFNSLQRDVARRRRNFEIFKKLLKFSSKPKMEAGHKFLRSNIFRALSYVLEELSDRILSLAMRCKTPPEPGTDTT